MKACFIFGTRPEAIKMAPVIQEFIDKGEKPIVLLTGQHAELLDQVIEVFNIPVYKNIHIMKPNQSLESLTARLITRISSELKKIQPDVVLVHGDTATTMIGALAAYYNKIPVAHVEAGLRTDDIYQPFPEEINRRIVGQIATYNFCPLIENMKNLALCPGKRYAVGNTVVDAVNLIRKKLGKVKKDTVLITTHRRENWGHLDGVYKAVSEMADKYTDLKFKVVLHPNPNLNVSGLITSKRVKKLPPQDYLGMAKLMNASKLILTDSGGIQEEAPSYEVPTLVARNTSERMASVRAEFSKLVGTDYDTIYKEMDRYLGGGRTSLRVPTYNPYGDGTTSQRIYLILKREVGG